MTKDKYPGPYKMKPQDAINGCFEFGGSLAVLTSILQVYHDKHVAGIHWAMILFFASWGYWNLYYYRHLQQFWSWTAGIFVTLANTVYLCLLIHYS